MPDTHTFCFIYITIDNFNTDNFTTGVKIIGGNFNTDNFTTGVKIIGGSFGSENQ